ncbi:tetraspanin-13-like isoform X1 [Zophobas morio]|uniref:tetraspanin-13-like isoform X1 n=1 Tax=Zophobas morio TaxID=2755281 RepID=UPI003083E8A0
MTNSIFNPHVSAMDPVTAFAKSLLLTCNIFLTVTGIGLLVYGLILLVIERRYMVIDNYNFSFENWIICTAVILLVVSLFGYYVNYKEIKTYLLLYAILLLLLFVVQVSVALFSAIVLHLGDGVNQMVQAKFEKKFLKNDTNFWKTFTDIQKNFRCCGVHGAKDYHTIPESCCQKRHTNGTCTKIFESSCTQAYSDALTPLHKSGGYICLVFSVLEPIGAWVALLIRKRLSASPDLPPETPAT